MKTSAGSTGTLAGPPWPTGRAPEPLPSRGLRRHRPPLLINMPDGPYGTTDIHVTRRWVITAGGDRRRLRPGDRSSSILAAAEGGCNQVRVRPSGKLLPLRLEAGDGKQYPTNEAPPDQFPRRVRVRDLQPDGKTADLYDVSDIPRHGHDVNFSPDGRFLAVDGVKADRDTVRLQVRDSLTGALRWAYESAGNPGVGHSHRFAATGDFISYQRERGTGPIRWVRSTDGRDVASADGPVQASPDSEWARLGGKAPRYGLNLYRRGVDEPVAALGVRKEVVLSAAFDKAVRRLAWDGASGRVYVADIAEVRRHLAAFGPGW